MRHLLTTTDFDKKEIEALLLRAEYFLKENVPEKKYKDKLLINIFFENSTRTRSSFEVAAKRLGLDVVNLDVQNSSTSKGETLYDTAANLDVMGPSVIAVRHKSSGVPQILSKYVSCSIVNGGDGAHAHPTQALLDLFTLKTHLKKLNGKKIAIVGDIKNSRVANSNIELLSRFGMEVILVAPPHFMPKTELKKSYNLKEIVGEVDAIMSLRTQTERHETISYASLKDYASDFCISEELIGDRNLVIMHPGPVHRNIDITDGVLSDPRCKVLEQVRNGVAIRMAVIEKLIADEPQKKN
jgi:aspartate carbamoyltransferase catalytic subunit